MPFGFGSGPGRAARRLRSSTPASIFGPNLRAWFDNQDLSTMWQDVAMTTPAAIGQGVAMQRCKVNPATFYRSQSTASRRPILRQTAGGVYYLECDGVDDGLVTPPLNLTSTDKMAIFVGLRKLSDAARSTYCEFSSSYGNPGTFAVESPGPGLTGIMMAHNGSTSPITSTGTAVAPMTAVISGLASSRPHR